MSIMKLLSRLKQLSPIASAPSTVSAAPRMGTPALRGGTAQLDGVDFQETRIEIADRVSDHETTIRSSLVYFKHRWPGYTAIPEGDYEFRSLARRIAAEVGVPVQGEREVAASPSDTSEAEPNAPITLPSAGQRN